MAFNKTNDECKSLNSNPSAYSYDEVFPALKTDGKPKTATGCDHVPPVAVSLHGHNRTMRINSSEVTQVFSVPAEERKHDQTDKFGELNSFQTCTQISKDTGADIEISTSKDKSLTFMITGKLNNVMEARKRVLTHFQTQANMTINIPKEHHRWVLGKSGQRLKELEKSTGTKITIPVMNEQSDKVMVTGPREGIERAVHEIRVISDEQSKKAFERVTIPKIYHPFITGAENKKLAPLMDDTGTRINVPPSSVDNDVITIAGEKQGVENAKNRLLQIYDEMERTCQTISVQVPKWQHKYVIGYRRATISEILQDTGVSVEVPPANVGVDTITLRGPCKNLGEALAILRLKATSMQCVEISIPESIQTVMQEKKGVLARELQDSYKQCHIEIMKEKIRVESLPEVINEMKEKIQRKIDYYLNEYDVVDIQVNRSHFKHIIGKSGVNVKRLKDDNDVSISITDKNNENKIRIEGSKEGVAQVKKELEEQIQKLENEKERDITIHHRHHRTLIGNKREKIKELQDTYKVLIIFPSPGDSSDIVKIKGQKNDVDACYKHLSKIVKEMNESSHYIEVPIYKQFHKCIIGKGGNTIKKIRDETGTKIDLPAEGEKSDVIIITGEKEKVEEAKERILKIQNEMANIVTEEVTMPTKLLSKKKFIIKAIKDDCGGIMIKMPTPENKSDKVIIRGPSEDVLKAKQQFLELASEKHQNSTTAEVRAKPELHKFLIGKNGIRIKKIRENTGARIIFPSETDDDKETILLMGRKEQCDRAKEELETLIGQINNTVEEYVHVNPKYHKSFIVNRGELIHKISDDCGGVIISFPRPSSADESRVVVKGNVQGVKEAIKTIERIVQDLENKYEDEVQVAPRHHKHFVSRKGEVLQSIVSECGGYDHVTISFPRTDIRDSKVLLKGSKEAVLIAKAKVLQIVKELEEQITIEVFIPNKDHRALLTSKTYPTVQDIRRTNNVKIAFPDRVTGNEYQQNGPVEVNGYSGDEQTARPCDIVQITGKPENCESAKKMLLDIVPVTLELDIPYSYHSSIIGTKGGVIREIIRNFDVQVDVPNSELKLDLIKIRGRPALIEDAKNAILKRKKEIDDDREEWERKSYEIELHVDPEFHPYIIGRGGEVINKIRADRNVQISLPKRKDSANGHVITIVGVQEDVEAAQADIMDIVKKLEGRFREEVTIDRRVHSRMIGSKGRNVKKIMEKYNVEIRFPRDSGPDENIVIISGEEENVLECKDYLLMLEEEYLIDVANDDKASVVAHNGSDNTRRNEAGFVVKNAPWDQKAPDTSSISEFPSFGGTDNRTFAQLESKAKTSAWGPRR